MSIKKLIIVPLILFFILCGLTNQVSANQLNEIKHFPIQPTIKSSISNNKSKVNDYLFIDVLKKRGQNKNTSNVTCLHAVPVLYAEIIQIPVQSPIEEPIQTQVYIEQPIVYQQPVYYEEPIVYEEPIYYQEEIISEPEYYYEAPVQQTYEEPYYYIEQTYNYDTTQQVINNNLTVGQEIVNNALQYVGNPYVYGGNSLTNGIDCSGFTQQILAASGITIDRTAESQSYGGEYVDLNNLQAGDLLFYDNGGFIGHVAIYCGDGTVVHASDEITGITVSDVDYRTPALAKRYW